MSARNDSEPNPTKNPTKVEAKSEREVIVTRTFDAPAPLTGPRQATGPPGNTY